MFSTSITTLQGDDSSVEINSNGEFRLKDLGISTAKFANGSVTGPKIAPLNIVSSSSSNNFSMSSSTYADVTNLSLSITTNGRPVMICLISDGSSNATSFRTADTGGAFFRLLRNGTEIANGFIGGSGVLSYIEYESNFMHFESSLSASTYTYTVQVKGAIGGSNVFMSYFKLIAFEF